jgi:hypothetical protein
MKSRTSFIPVTLILATCLACPLVEMFDRWDKTLQTGTDTEYAFVVLALCVGVAYLFARLVPKIFLLGSAAEALSGSSSRPIFPALMRGSYSAVLIPVSPPTLALRV